MVSDKRNGFRFTTSEHDGKCVQRDWCFELFEPGDTMQKVMTLGEMCFCHDCFDYGTWGSHATV